MAASNTYTHSDLRFLTKFLVKWPRGLLAFARTVVCVTAPCAVLGSACGGVRLSFDFEECENRKFTAESQSLSCFSERVHLFINPSDPSKSSIVSIM
eukprot:scaffold14401_cov146-Skeletonema_marinoi.AAC.2